MIGRVKLILYLRSVVFRLACLLLCFSGSFGDKAALLWFCFSVGVKAVYGGLG